MGLYKGPSCKLCRREGLKLFLKSIKCETPKCPLSRRSYPPGFHGPLFRGKMSEYALRLREKQKARRFYYISEGQFRRYYDMASRMHGDTGEELLQIVERRLDNFVFRAGLAATRRQARQIVKHGHVLVNKKRVDIPSYLVKVGDEISVDNKSVKSFEDQIEVAKKQSAPTWMKIDFSGNSYVFLKIPTREELNVPINEQFVIEYYSR